ncbi:hypothetical protein MMC25_006261 [Agyrium rufum]|nr:hypothetical protein [Agyrium rufum]
MSPTHILQFARPRSFLYLMSLQTGTSLSILTLLLNKVSGVYGILALTTGYAVSPLQLSMYIYSIIILILVAKLAPHIKTQKPLENLALAYVFVIDTLINTFYNAIFAATWFLVVAQHPSTTSSTADGISNPASPKEMQDSAAGFTNPQLNVSSVSLGASEPGTASGVIGIVPASTPGGASSTSAGAALFQTESLPSLISICVLWLGRIYLCLLVLSYARFVLRQHIAHSSRLSIPPPPPPAQSSDDTDSPSGSPGHSRSSSSSAITYAPDPFAPHLPTGQGYRGRLGRAMLSVGKGYWLGREENDDWLEKDSMAAAPLLGTPIMPSGVSNKPASIRSASGRDASPGPMERERRRRSGTGPSGKGETAAAAAVAAALGEGTVSGGASPVLGQNPSGTTANGKMGQWLTPNDAKEAR